MADIEIIQTTALARGIWAVHYWQYSASQGCCGSLHRTRKTIIIRQISKPAQKTIDDAIKNQKSGN
jgi:hypothetical protein